MNTAPAQRVAALLNDAFGTLDQVWAQQEFHAAVAKLIARVSELHVLRDLQRQQQQGVDRG